MKIKTGKGTISLRTQLAIWSVSAVISLPGLAVSPIMGTLTKVFPHASDLEIQMLTSLPSLLIIPFILLSGRLSVRRSKLGLLFLGLSIFFLSGAAFFFARSMGALIVLSCVLGAGAGMVIPLATGLVADYFWGRYRTRQLGLSSAINNMTLVLATFLAGYLARFGWHYPFAVYLIPAVTLLLALSLRRTTVRPADARKPSGAETIDRETKGRITSLMALHFFITYAVLVVVLYLPFILEARNIDASVSGTLIALFFLSIMLPGLFLNKIIDLSGQYVNFYALLIIVLGLFILAVSRRAGIMAIGCMLPGLGYGIMQPIIYDKASEIVVPSKATFSLALVMSVNYLAIFMTPFIVGWLKRLLRADGSSFPFLLNLGLTAAVAAVAYIRRKRFVYGSGAKMDSAAGK